MKNVDDARELATTMVELGADHGVRTVALLTDMYTPLGLTAGNALEVRESVEVLAGGGPADVVELTVALAREMLDAAGLPDADPAKALADGSAMDVWREMVTAQGGDADAELPWARERHVVKAATSGVLTRLDAYAVGLSAWRLGAGRARKEDPVQAGAGIELHARPGDHVTAGAAPADPPHRHPRRVPLRGGRPGERHRDRPHRDVHLNSTDPGPYWIARPSPGERPQLSSSVEPSTPGPR